MADRSVAGLTVADRSVTADPGPRRTPERHRPLLVAVAIVLALAAGLAAGATVVPRLRTPGDTSAEAGFAWDMTDHHAQAVDMGMIAYRSAADPEVRQVAADIAATQQAEIGMMRTWLRTWRVPLTSTDAPMGWMPPAQRHLAADGRMPGMATQQELDGLRRAAGRQVDITFLQLMIRHHVGGAHMVEAVLAVTDEPIVREAAGNMRTVQGMEVANMTALLRRLGGTPLPA